MTQQQKVLAMMIRGPKDAWWHAYDYIGQVGDLFVGHRAPARISEIARKHPEMIETMRDPDKPRLHMYRFRHDNFAQFRHLIPEDIKSTVVSEMLAKGLITGDRY